MAEELHPYSKEVAKGSFWGMLGSVSFKLVSFVYVILIARAASADDVGLFYLALSVVGLVSIFSDFGMPAALARYVPYLEGKGEKKKISGILLANYLLSGGASAILAIIMWLGSDAIGAAYQNLALPESLRILSVYLFLNTLFRIHTIYLQGRSDIKSTQFVSNIQNLAKLLVTLVLFQLFGATVATIAWGFVISFVFAIILSLPSMWNGLKDIPPVFSWAALRESSSDRPLLREAISFGLMLTVVGSLWTLMSSTDRLLLGYLSPPDKASELIAIYSIAGNLAFVLTTFPGAIEGAFLPIISRAVGRKEMDQVRSVTATAQRWALLLTIPATIVVVLFAGDIMDAFYGDFYRAGANVFALLALAFLVRSAFSMLSLTLAAMRLVQLELKVAAAATILNAALNILLIPMYGVDGSALALLITFILMLILFAYYAWKNFGFVFPPEVYKLAMAGAVAFIMVLAIRIPLSSLFSMLPALPVPAELEAYSVKFVYLAFIGVLMSISVVFFAFAALSLKCLHSEDISMVEKILSRGRVPPGIISLAVRTASYGVPGPK
jgi:O-antigen/teichoic acid export membrane protein